MKSLINYTNPFNRFDMLHRSHSIRHTPIVRDFIPLGFENQADD